jgi:hypothetical protein
MIIRLAGHMKTLVTAALALAWLAGTATATELPQPEGRVVLTVTGAIERTTDGLAARFDMAMLKTLPRKTIRTSTPWTQGVTEFTGVVASALMDRIGARSGAVTVTALNDYAVEMTVADLVDTGAILAYEVGGKALSVREKGPLWIIFPFDSDKAFQTDTWWSKSVWQVRDMDIR